MISLQISHGIGLNILAFIPTVILGIIGGLLGAVFTFVNLKVQCAISVGFDHNIAECSVPIDHSIDLFGAVCVLNCEV